MADLNLDDFDFGEDFDPYADTRTSADAERAGVWEELTPRIRARIRRLGPQNESWMRAQEAAFKGIRGGAQSNDKAATEIHARLFAAHVVADWQIKDKNDNWVSAIYDYETKKPVKVSVEAVKKVLLADGEIFSRLVSKASANGTFLKSLVENDTKN